MRKILSKTFLIDRPFLKRALPIAVPIALRSFIISLINTMDNFMLGRLPDADVLIASVGICAQIIFLVQLCLFGFASGMSIFLAQYKGKGDIRRFKASIIISVTINFLLTLIACSIMYFGAPFLLDLFTNDENVILYGSQYLKIVAFGMPFLGLVFSFSIALQNAHYPVFPFVVSVIQLLWNGFWNYILIYGNFGFPALGLNGAAYATVSAHIIGLIINLIYSFSGRRCMWMQFGLRHCKYITAEKIRLVLRTSFPVLGHEFMWSLSITTIYWIFAHLPTTQLAAYTLANSIMQLVFIFNVGNFNAAAIILGNSIGARKISECRSLIRKFCIMSLYLVLWMIIGNTIIMPQFLFLFKGVQELALVKLLLIGGAIMAPSGVFAGLCIVGILRSGGDTRFAFFAEVGGSWLISVPLCWLALSLGLHPLVMLLCSKCGEVVVTLRCLRRIRSGQWIKVQV